MKPPVWSKMSERPRTMTAEIWAIHFEDADCEAEVFKGEGAEEAARLDQSI